MNKYLQPFLIIGLAILASCGGDDPLPAPEVSFITDPGVVEVGVPVQFENQSLKASSYLWEVGDITSEEVSPSFVFDSRGEIYVKLTAITDDNQMVTDSLLISVKERVLTAYYVNIFPETKGAEFWDVDPVGDDTEAADLLIFFLANEAENLDNALFEGIFEVPNAPLFRFANDQNRPFAPITLTNETWSFSLTDFDGDFNDIQNTLDQSETVIELAFNPVQAPTIKSEDESGGLISIFYQDQTTGYILDLDLEFELQ
ncbi:MAG: PKD domain-containing protein [Cyclobacteriaceae bacterium]